MGNRIGTLCRVIAVLPRPEILVDLPDVRAAGDRFERFVIHRQHGGAGDRLALGIAQGDTQGGSFARFHPALGGFERDFDNLANRRQQDLPDRGMNLRAVDADALDEHVRHVAEIERDIDFKALAIELDAAGLASGGACDVEEEPDVGVVLVAVHAEFRRLAGSVGRLVGDDFQRAEMPVRGIDAAGAMDVENRRAFRRIAVLERQARRQTILTGGGRGEALFHFALRIGLHRKGLDFLLFDAAVTATG